MPNGIHGGVVERNRLGSVCLLVAWLAAVPLLHIAQAAGTTAPTQAVTQQILLDQATLKSVRDELIVNQQAQKVPNTPADRLARLKEREARLIQAERRVVAELQALRDEQKAHEREEARARQKGQARPGPDRSANSAKADSSGRR